MSHFHNPTWLVAAVLAIIFNPSFTPATAAPLSGTRAIGPTGDYVSITAAIADVQAQTLGGALVLELQTNYICSVETFPLVFGSLPTTAANTLTLRPQLGATNLVISSAVSDAVTVDLNGAQFLTIDGRPGGAGTNSISGGGAASQLTIANTSIYGLALRFIDGADYNTIRYAALQGVNNSAYSGVVLFGTTTGANGNNDNTLDHCDIHDGASSPVNGICAGGSAAPKDNRGNTISDCNIFNFYTSAGDQYGILLQGGNTAWTITGNSFYQMINHNGPGHTVGAIFLNNPAGNDFVISNNAIGGSAPNASGTWYYATYSGNSFIGILLNVGSTIPSSVQGNLIQGFAWLTTQNLSTAPGVWGGIAVSGGAVNIGTAAGNTIGGSGVTITSSGSGALATGISSSGSNTVVIANNTIQSMAVYGSNTLVSASLTGIQVTAGTNTIGNNLIGVTGSQGNNFEAGTASTSTIGTQAVTGISSSSTNSTIITGNTVASLYNNYASIFGGQVRGIITYAGVNTITGNTVRNLTTTCGDGNDGASSSVLGICQTSGQPGQNVSQNNVNSLANTAATSGVVVTGIWYAGATNGVNLIARNLVHSLAISSTNNLSVLEGMFFGAGSFTAQNNMVRVGIRAGGGSTAGASVVYGIDDDGQDAGRYFYHNSVYVGGTESATKYPTMAFFSAGLGNDRAFQNNIFVNARNKTGGTGYPYAVFYGNSGRPGLKAGGNLFLASGTGGVLGFYNSTNYTTLAAWQAVTGQDADSLVADPIFVNPTGSYTTVNLHVSSNSPAINAGLAIGVTNDFDGDLRNATKPTIGADEYIANYALVPGYNQLSAQAFVGGGTNLLAFQGMPTFNYALEMATNLVPPVFWQPLFTNNAAANGGLFFTNAMSPSRVFFRTRYAP